MKEVKDMTLTECIDRLRELPNGTCEDQFDMRDLPWIWDVAEELADRIDTLLFKQAQRHDGWVDALENKINSLEAQHRWIPVSERLPTKEDKDVIAWYSGEYPFATLVNWFDFPLNNKQLNYWKSITPPEGV